MKKFLTILGSLMVAPTATSLAVSCAVDEPVNVHPTFGAVDIAVVSVSKPNQDNEVEIKINATFENGLDWTGDADKCLYGVINDNNEEDQKYQDSNPQNLEPIEIAKDFNFKLVNEKTMAISFKAILKEGFISEHHAFELVKFNNVGETTNYSVYKMFVIILPGVPKN